MKKIYFLLLACSMFESSAQTTLTLTPLEDAPIGYHDGANTANMNYKTAQQCAAFAIPSVASQGGLNVNKGLMKFDLSSIPLGATITDARLDLYAYNGAIGVYSGHMGPNNSAYIERVTSIWDENTVTWNTQPTTTASNRVFLSGTTMPNLDYTNIDLTQLIQDIYTSPTNYGIELKMVVEAPTNILAFCSKDYSNPLKHPKLRLSYSLPLPSSLKEMNNRISDFTYFPNPVNTSLNISFNSIISGQGKISIYDNQGRFINESSIEITNKTNSYTINISTLTKGIYYISLSVNDNHKSGKFIIQ